MELQSLPHDGLCSVARHDDVVLIDVHGAIHARHMDAVEALTQTIQRDTDGTFGILVRVAEGVSMPTLETRSRFVAYLWSQRERVRAIHVALEGHGFWAATMTALAATVARAVPHGPAIHVHDCLDQAASALTEHLRRGCGGMSCDGRELIRAFRRAS